MFNDLLQKMTLVGQDMIAYPERKKNLIYFVDNLLKQAEIQIHKNLSIY